MHNWIHKASEKLTYKGGTYNGQFSGYLKEEIYQAYNYLKAIHFFF